MKKIFLSIFFLGSIIAGIGLYLIPNLVDRSATSQSGLPIIAPPDDMDMSFLADWVRPEGPAKVGLQVGHWKNDEVPEELARIRGNTGAREVLGMSEANVAYAIAEDAAVVLRSKGVVVDILPATVPPKYWADVFISIHADDHTDSSKSGYKFAGPRRDYTGKTQDLVKILEDKYEEVTGLERDPNVTRNMRGYYAFSWWRFDHAIHPMTVGVIAETGFMSNDDDAGLLINNPEIPGGAIADALIQYLSDENLLGS